MYTSVGVRILKANLTRNALARGPRAARFCGWYYVCLSPPVASVRALILCRMDS